MERVSDFPRPQVPQVDGAAGTGAHTGRGPARVLPRLPTLPARPRSEQHLNPPTFSDREVVARPRAPAPPPPAPGSGRGGPGGAGRRGRGSRHLQLTLQSTVQSQWQKQKQWKVHSLLTITGRPRGAVRRRAAHILPTYLSFLSRLAWALGN